MSAKWTKRRGLRRRVSRLFGAVDRHLESLEVVRAECAGRGLLAERFAARAQQTLTWLRADLADLYKTL